ncbi:MAG: YqgE/AlgH family protein [Bacteroidetes bacterium]|nr:YqgE/AlgH family protein [Bacteroidota bacterium]
MNFHPGTIIKATTALSRTYFGLTSILITEYNEKGAMGFIINKLFPKKLNDLHEFRHSAPFPIYEGGPVDNEHLYMIHCRPDLIEEGINIYNNIYYGGNFKQAITAINNKSLKQEDIKIFIGYCGWDLGELESEIDEGSWEITLTNLF